MNAPALADLETALAADVYGGKAAGLALAMRAGLPVPAGFALGADALAELVAGREAGSLRAALRELLAALGGGPVAVRSSAVGEDSAGASFAGQHASVLGPTHADAVIAALARVHDSAHTAAAGAYRRRMGLASMPRIGAVVQRLVPADVAGVMFTREPGGGQRIVVEASLGLGESVVAGHVTPDHFELDRDGALLAMDIGAKELALRVDSAAGTTRREPVDTAMATRPCLNPGELGCLADLARRAEQALGAGQDVEWALSRGELHLLQSRPIGTPGRPHRLDSKSTGAGPSWSVPREERSLH